MSGKKWVVGLAAVVVLVGAGSASGALYGVAGHWDGTETPQLVRIDLNPGQDTVTSVTSVGAIGQQFQDAGLAWDPFEKLFYRADA